MKRRNFIGTALKLAGGAALGFDMLSTRGDRASVMNDSFLNNLNGFGEKTLYIERTCTDYDFDYHGAVEKLHRLRKVFHEKYKPDIGPENLPVIYNILKDKPFNFVFNPDDADILMLSEGFKKNALDCDTSSYLYLDLADIEGMWLYGVRCRGKSESHFYVRYIDKDGNQFNFQSNGGFFGAPTKDVNEYTQKELSNGIFDLPLSNDQLLANIYFKVGVYWDNKKNYKTAARFFKKATELDDLNMPAFYRLSLCLSDMGKYREAIQAAERSTLGGREGYVNHYRDLKAARPL
ncbi:MAG: hypothetical protein NTU57_05490 [Candidatus Aenigmarchaeota archaeon]|nr:hypothetical protein [Candidatus Aenigmarchaeota archaeon]